MIGDNVSKLFIDFVGTEKDLEMQLRHIQTISIRMKI